MSVESHTTCIRLSICMFLYICVFCIASSKTSYVCLLYIFCSAHHTRTPRVGRKSYICICICICSVSVRRALRWNVAHVHCIVARVCVCCSVLHCVAVCCIVLQCVAVCCSVLQCVAVCCSVLVETAFRWSAHDMYDMTHLYV